MSRPRRRVVVAATGCGLAPETVDVLLGGWTAPNINYSADPRSDPFEVFTIDLPAAWLRHRTWLLREWRRRGGDGRPWGSQFDAEGA